MKKKLAIGVLAHVDSGKTTLSEAMLYLSGEIRTLGRVDRKDAFLDTNEIERSRGITIFSKQATFSVGETDFTLLDTPGHVDFSAETERALSLSVPLTVCKVIQHLCGKFFSSITSLPLYLSIKWIWISSTKKACLQK